RHTLQVTFVRNRHNHFFISNQVFHLEFISLCHDLSATLVAVSFTDSSEFCTNNASDESFAAQNLFQASDLFHDSLVISNDLIALKASKALETHIQDSLCLNR